MKGACTEFSSIVLTCYSLDGIYWSHLLSSHGESFILLSLCLWNKYFLEMLDEYNLMMSTRLSKVQTATVVKKYSRGKNFPDE